MQVLAELKEKCSTWNNVKSEVETLLKANKPNEMRLSHLCTKNRPCQR
jgi:hypothetical protein